MKAKIASLTAIFFVSILCVPLTAMGTDEVQYKVRLVTPPPLERPLVEVSKELLPKGSKGSLPTFDGDRGHLNLPPQYMIKDINELVAAYLLAIGWTRAPEEMRSIDAVSLPAVDKQFIEREIKEKSDRKKRELMERKGFRKLNAATEKEFKDSEDLLRKQARKNTKIFRFAQYVKETPVYDAGLVVVTGDDSAVEAIAGRVFNQIETGNTRKMEAKDSILAAQKYVMKYSDTTPEPRTKPELFLLPYGKVFLYAWTIEVMAEGPYRIWVDAEKGSVLWVEPMFHFAGARGLVFDPDPVAGTEEHDFSVDAASGGQYRLLLTGEADMDNNGADSVCSGDLTIADDGSGTANFNVSPINGTVVERTSDTGYNCRFQDVNVFAWVNREIELYEMLGSQAFPSMSLTVNEISPCGYNSSNACSGGSYLEFGIGQATISSSTDWCTDAFNNALEGPTIAHELGHSLNKYQYASALATAVSIPSFMNEGMADYWAYSMHDTTTIGGWIRRNCTTISQGGWRPRQADALDIFPDHRSLATGAYADGQIVSWALWNDRRELLDASALGNLSLYVSLLKAMTTSGSGAGSSTDRQTHDTVINLLEELATQYKDSWWAHKILSGFARAGFFLGDRDAVIDINDDYLDRGSAAGPTFTVWTGRDYSFTAGGAVNTTTMPCNTRYTIDVANNSAFSVNLRSSGVLSGITSSDGCTADWTLPAADWTAVKSADVLYYRVTTTDDAGGNARSSDNPGEFFPADVPVARAVINESGECECNTCSLSSAETPKAAGAAILLPVLAAVIIRRRYRDDK